ncbi:zinc finger, CCHC-type containing protein [Tanacetum coccineum]
MLVRPSITTIVVNNSVFRGFFKKQKLTGPNFIDWYRQLRIVLSTEDKLNYLEIPILVAPVPAVSRQQVPPETLAAHAAWVNGQKEIVVLMLMTMELDLQQNQETLGAYDMLKELKTLFSQQAEHEVLQTVREFHACKQEEGQFVSSYVLKMKSYIDNLERLGHPVSLNLAVSLILVSLRKEYDCFVQNYNMHSMEKTVNELHAMLKLHDQTLPKRDAPALHEIRAGKAIGSGTVPLSELLKNKKLPQGASTSGIFTIKLFSFPGKPWVYDTGYGTHICNTTQGLWGSRKLKSGALSLYIGNGQRAAVEAIGSSNLCFPSGLVIVLHNCHYAPSITRGFILVSRLYDDGFINHFDDDNTILVSRNNLVYFSAITRDGIYEIDLSNSNTNNHSMYAVSNKRAKLNLHSSLLWHYRLGHISKKRIEKLQQDGLLNSIDTKSFEKCVSCLLTVHDRKGDLMAKAHQTPYKVWYGQAPKLSYLKVCGCEALVKRDTLTKPNKLEPRSIKCIFVGYPKETIGYSLYYPLENKVFIAWNTKFFENNLITQEASGSLEDLEIIQEEDMHPSENTSSLHDEDNEEINEPQSDIIPIRRSTRTRHAPDRMCLNIEADEYELGDLNEPANYKAALLDPESEKWLNAMNWLFKKKTDMDRAVHTYKARLVAKGYTQTPKIDYEETFSPVADIRAIRILIAIVDVKSYLGRCFAMNDLGEAAYILGINIYRDRSKWLIELGVSCYTDVGYLTDADDLKSQTGYVFVLNGGAVDWNNTKQSIFATSFAEAEYIAALDASKEAVWVRKFISGLGVVPIIEEPIKMYYESTESITIANESGISKGARHYRAKVHYLREVIEFGDVKIEKVHTDDNLADPFTKALAFLSIQNILRI